MNSNTQAPGPSTSNDHIEWEDASTHYPCLRCGGRSWCSFAEVDDGQLVYCRRDSGDPSDPHFLKAKTDKNGQIGFLYKFRDGEVRTRDGSPSPRPVVESADRELLDRFYRALVEALELSAEHHADLVRRGLSDAQIEASRIRSMPAAEVRHRIVDAIRERLGLTFAELAHIPGLIRDEHGYRLYGPMGLVIPVMDAEGRIAGIQIRPDRPIVIDGKVKGKYLWLSSPHGGPRITAAAHVPPHDEKPHDVIRLTEGPLKADVATARGDLLTIGVPGVGTWRRALQALKTLAVKVVRLAFDNDCLTNPDVAGALSAAYQGLKAEGYKVEVERWQVEAGKGIDDVLVGGGTTEVLSGRDANRFVKSITPSSDPTDQDKDDGREPIKITPDFHKVVDQSAAVIVKHFEVYVRNNLLVLVLRKDRGDARDPRGVLRAAGSPLIIALNAVMVRTLLSRLARYWAWDRREKNWVRKPPSRETAEAVVSLGSYPGGRVLTGIVEAPTLRPDGTLITVPGYDPRTGLLYLPNDAYPAIPEKPTLQEAAAAVDVLYAVVCDFPFKGPAHKAAWLAALLTVLARFAIDGPVPMFLIDATTAGSGKTLLCHIIAVIVTGREMAVTDFPADPDELRKLLLALGLSGDWMMLFDNIAAPLGGSALEAAITTPSIKGRILGRSEMVAVDLCAVLFGTGNNTEVRGDAPRRIILSRLEPNSADPETRDTFTIQEPLLDYCKRNRGRLISAALTILRGYIAAGRPLPEKKLPAFGTFEQWSGLVRHAVHWATGSDPWEARDELKVSNPEKAAQGAIVDGWAELPGADQGVTTAEALKLLKTPDNKTPDKYETLRAAIATRSGELPSTVSLGRKLSAIRGKIINGKVLHSIDAGKNTLAWKVDEVPSGGDGGDGGGCYPPSHVKWPSESGPVNGDSAYSRDGEGNNPHHPHHPHHNGNGEQTYTPDSPDDSDREVFVI